MTMQRNDILGSQKFADIREGMSVYDVDDKRVGTVKQIYFGASSERANAFGEGAATAPEIEPPEHDSLMADLAQGFYDDGRFPEPLRKRLLHEGFLRIDAGLLASGRYVMPDQIDNAFEDRVNLNVRRNELVKG